MRPPSIPLTSERLGGVSGPRNNPPGGAWEGGERGGAPGRPGAGGERRGGWGEGGFFAPPEGHLKAPGAFPPPQAVEARLVEVDEPRRALRRSEAQRVEGPHRLEAGPVV